MDLDLYRHLLRAGPADSRAEQEDLLIPALLQRAARTRHYRGIVELGELEPSDREDIRTDPHAFVDPDCPGPLHEVATAGTTGNPLRFWRSGIEEDWWLAFVAASWARMGVAPGDRGVILTGRPLPRAPDGFAQHRPGTATLWLSCAVWGDETWRKCWQQIDEFQPAYIRGYPSLVAELATWLEANGGVPPSSVRGVAYSSEVATRSQLRTIQRVFGFQPVGLYGHTERTVMAATCEHGRYHPWPQYGLIELLDATGNRIDEPGVEGEIVTTSLQPRATVFARYRTGDRGEWAPNCGCGLTDRVLGRIAGRTREFLDGTDGSRIMFGPAVYGRLVEDLPRANSVQFVHPGPGQLVVRVVGLDVGLDWILDRLPPALKNWDVALGTDGLFRTSAGKVPLLVK